jgi:hypothetical protein
MAHLLIADERDAVVRGVREALEPRGHVLEQAPNFDEAVGLVRHCRAIQDPFDLLILGSFAGGDADQLIQALDPVDTDHAVALLGSDVAPDAPLPGVLAALGKRGRYLGRLEEWDLALDYLQRLEGTQAEREAIAAHQARLAGEATLAQFEQTANAVLQPLGRDLAAYLLPLAEYQATPSFWVALRHVFVHERVRCYALLAVLRRLAADKLAHGTVVAPGHFEYPVGGDHFVYFRWANGRRVLEDFVPSARRQATIERLGHAPEPVVEWVAAAVV